MHSCFASRLIFLTVSKTSVAKHDNSHHPGVLTRDQQTFKIRLAHSGCKSVVSLCPVTASTHSLPLWWHMSEGKLVSTPCMPAPMWSAVSNCALPNGFGKTISISEPSSYTGIFISCVVFSTTKAVELWHLCFPVTPYLCNNKTACPAVSWLTESTGTTLHPCPVAGTKNCAPGGVQSTKLLYYPRVPD